jgi:AsmA protein
MRKLILITGAIIVIFIVAVTALVLFVDVESYRHKVEAAASDALGMNFRIKGRMGLSLYPAIGVKLDEIELINRGSSIASAERLRIRLELFPLLKKELHITRLEIIRPSFSIKRDLKGRFNFESSGKKSKGSEGNDGLYTMRKLLISEGTLVYSDAKSKQEVTLSGFDITLKNLTARTGKGIAPLKNISFEGELIANKMSMKEITASQLTCQVSAKNGEFVLDPISIQAFGGNGKARVRVDLSGKSQLIELEHKLSRFSIEKFLDSVSRKHVLTGKMDYSLKLTMEGNTSRDMKKSMKGNISLRGKDLVLNNLDLDRLLAQYEKSQTFNLVDVGAFFLAGPIGTTLTKGYDFKGVYQKTKTGEKGMISRLVSDWKVKKGIAEAIDVAFTTKHNRIAVKGKTDFVHERFDNVTVALLDKKGCAKFRQRISGPFKKPEIGKTDVLMSIVGPVLSLFEKTKEFVYGKKCQVFYRGSVKHPG